MGFEDRQYFRQDNYGSPQGFSLHKYSIITILIVINVAIFFLDTFTPKTSPLGSHWLSDMLAVNSDRPWAIWTYLTSGFAHAPLDSKTSFWHVAGNMFGLWMFGRPILQRIGRTEFLKFYLLAIVVSGVGFTAIRFATGQVPFSIYGASGGVAAVIGLFIIMYPRENVYLMGLIRIPAWVFGIIILLGNIRYSFDKESHIAWEAHLIGLAFGVAYFYFKWNFSKLQMGNPKRFLKSRPKLKVHNPDGVDEKLRHQGDLILQKIALEGEESLTAKERKILNKYSTRLRKHRNDA